jgi:hypothetical protein
MDAKRIDVKSEMKTEGVAIDALSLTLSESRVADYLAKF